MSTIEDSLDPPFAIARPQRDATVVIRGYVYQVNTTILKWIELKPRERLELEAGEDIDALQQAMSSEDRLDRYFHAVKFRERNLTLRSPEALSALAAFHEHRRNNPSSRLFFRYVTNSSVGIEKPTLQQNGTPGIHLWEQVRTGSVTGRSKSAVLSALRKFLRGTNHPDELNGDAWDSFQGFLKQCTTAQFNCFVDAFEWGTNDGSLEDVEGKAKYALVNSGHLRSVSDVDAAFKHLFHVIFTLLSQRSPKVLTPEQLSQELSKCDQAESGEALLSKLRETERILESGFNRLRDQIAPIHSDVRDIKGTLQRIEAKQGSNILSSALLAQNEALAATISQQAKNQILAIRETARRGALNDALAKLAAFRADLAAWRVLPAETKAEFLRLQASILLGLDDRAEEAKRILDEATSTFPTEGDSRLRACVALSEGRPDEAMSFLQTAEQPESRNLLALVFFLTGRREEAWKALPALEMEPTVRAETLRIRALGLLLEKDVVGARTNIELALELAPDWPSLQLASASIYYYEALAPAGIPSRLQKSPEPDNAIFGLNTPEAKDKLRKAAAIFSRIAQSLDITLDERRSLEVWFFACLIADRSRSGEARDYAKSVLDADPGQYRLVPWVLSQRYDGFDLSAAEETLAATIDGADVFHVIALVMLRLAESRSSEAIATLDRNKNAFLPDNENAWHHWRAVALLSAGEFEQARKELEQYDPDRRDPLWPEVQRLESRISGDWDAYQEALKARWLATESAEALFEYCRYAAHRNKWSLVAPVGSALVQQVGTPDALHLAAVAMFNVGQTEPCLRLLEDNHQHVSDEIYAEHFQRLSIACSQKLGQLLVARQKAQELCKSSPTTHNLLLLAQLQLDTGDVKALALTCRTLTQHELASDQALRLAMLVRHEDVQLARTMWRRAVAKGLLDEGVGPAISLAYRLGLDADVRPLMARMNELAEAGKGGIERKTLAELIEFAKKHQEDVELFSSRYAKGEIAVHLIPTRVRAQLAELYHTHLVDRESEPERRGASLLSIHGRPRSNSFPEEIGRPRLNVDITSLLLAYHLDLLPRVERAFGTIRIPPSIFPALTAMQDSISAVQMSQIEAAREVIRAVEGGLLTPVDGQSENPSAELANLGGQDWAVLYELCRRRGGRVVDFLPKIVADQAATLPEDAELRLANCRAMADELRRHGAVSAETYTAALSNLGTEGEKQPFGEPIDRNCIVYFQTTAAKLLASSGLLRSACKTFQVCMLRSDVDELKNATIAQERANELAEWIGGLVHYLRDRIEAKAYEFMAKSPAGTEEATEIWESSFELQCLHELLTFTPEPADIAWADDRYVNGYLQRDTVPIVSILEILKQLVITGEMTEPEYFRVLNTLRAAKCSFIPLEQTEILHHLVQAPVSGSSLSETPELGVLRRYWAENLHRGKNLQSPGSSAAHPYGEAAFLSASTGAIREAIAGLWSTNITQAEEEREVRAAWVLAALNIDLAGIRVISELTNPTIPDDELVGFSLSGLVTAGLQMRLSGRYTNERLSAYMRWLDLAVLRRAFERDPNVLQSTATVVRILIKSLWTRLSKRRETHPLLAVLLRSLPNELRDVVQADKDLSEELGIATASIVAIGPLRFATKEYLAAAREAINGRQSGLNLWRSNEKITFEPAESGIALRSPAGDVINHADPLLELLADDVDRVKAALDVNNEWFDTCPQDQEKIVDELLQEEPIARAEAVQAYRQRSAAVFYHDLPTKLLQQDGIFPDDLRPPDEKSLLRHYRLMGDLSTDKLKDRLASASAERIKSLGLTETLIRCMGTPIPLSQCLLESVAALSASEKRPLVKTLLRRTASPISTIHFVRLLTYLADTPRSKYWRLATRRIGSLLSIESVQQFSAFKNLLRWTDDAFGTWPATSNWSIVQRLAAVWAHANRIFSTLLGMGVPIDWIEDRFERPDLGRCYGVFEPSTEYFQDVANPQRLSREAFLLAGLCYAVPEKGAEWWPSNVRRLLLDMVHSAPGELDIHPELLRDRSRAGNVLGSFLESDLSWISYSILGDESSAIFQLSNLKRLAAEGLESALSQDCALGWGLIYRVLGDLPPEDSQRERMASAIQKIEVAPVADDLNVCRTFIYAAAMQTAATGDVFAGKHLAEEMVHIAGLLRQRIGTYRELDDETRCFLASLFSAAIHVCQAAENPVKRLSTFAEIFIRITDVFPESAAIPRYFLHRMWPCRVAHAKWLWPLLIRSRAVEE